eukprot:SAG31_NODE_259_length_18917_cov_28.559677_9_plen_103_part_00
MQVLALGHLAIIERRGSECGQLGQKIPLNYTGIVFLKYLEGADRAHDAPPYFGPDESTANDYPRSAVFDPLRRTPYMINRIINYHLYSEMDHAAAVGTFRAY